MDISLFEDDWKECLRAHYDYVVREHDGNNEESLISVLLQTGFTEDEIALMRAETLSSFDEDFTAPPESKFEPAEVTDQVTEVVSEFIEAALASDAAGSELFEPPVSSEMLETQEVTQTLETPEVMEILEEEEQAEDEPPESENFTQMSMF